MRGFGEGSTLRRLPGGAGRPGAGRGTGAVAGPGTTADEPGADEPASERTGRGASLRAGAGRTGRDRGVRDCPYAYAKRPHPGRTGGGGASVEARGALQWQANSLLAVLPLSVQV